MEGTANIQPRGAPARIRYCVVPGCSHRARRTYAVLCSVGEGTAPALNEIEICPVHHACLRKGYLRVRGRAPDGLVWKLENGERFTGGA